MHEAWSLDAGHNETFKQDRFSSRVSSGFPSPASDYVEPTLDLNRLLIDKPAATFFVRMSGDALLGAHIMNGDILIIDRSKEPAHGSIVMASVDGGDHLIRRFMHTETGRSLIAENPSIASISIIESSELQIFGVCVSVVRKSL